MSSMPCMYVPSDEGEGYDSRKNFCVDCREGSWKVCRKTMVEIKVKDSSADTKLGTIGLQTWTGLDVTNLMPYEPVAGHLLGFGRDYHGYNILFYCSLQLKTRGWILVLTNVLKSKLEERSDRYLLTASPAVAQRKQKNEWLNTDLQENIL
jgi:hypothetical protein